MSSQEGRRPPRRLTYRPTSRSYSNDGMMGWEMRRLAPLRLHARTPSRSLCWDGWTKAGGGTKRSGGHNKRRDEMRRDETCGM
ncbi:hypothetical protein Mapa_008691 [Marchantia paleacea]|nr:hypothetical protein Mapa_008691 [Marchantia paleacea]